MDNTRNLMEFGIRELRYAARLLSLFKTSKDHTRKLGDSVAVEFNPNSGYVFLVDEDFNVAMVQSDTLRDWFTCPECGEEGFEEVLKNGKPCCRQYLFKTEF